MLSFIVPAHDEAPLLGATVAALRRAADALRLDHEIIVVDDASSDDTGGVAARAGARVLRVDCRHIAASRNAGARVARGETLVFVDADTLIDARVLQAALGALAQGAHGGGATVRLRRGARLRHRAGAHVVGHALRLARIAPGCFLFCRRHAFVAAGGFDERYYAAEDVALSRALGRRGRFVVLREPVWTSDRKLRTFGVGEHLALLLRLARSGGAVLRSREHLGLWYAKRRHGPTPPD